MRLPLRSLASLVLAVGVATCSDAPSLGPTPANAPGIGRLALAPVFSATAAAALSQRSLFADVTFDHVRIVLVRPPSDTVKDTTIVFTPGSPPVTLVLTVPVRNPGERFNAVIDFTSVGNSVFRGEGSVESKPVDEPAPTGQEIVVQYVGIGANATRVVVSPKTLTLESPRTATFTAAAFDAAGNAVTGVPLSWSSSDPTVATINATTGALATTGKRGTTTVTVRTPNQLSDNGVVTVTLPPTGITLVSGGGQTGKAGAALAQPGVVRVVASDNAGVAGVTVTFGAPAGGSVGSASVTTDANGQASTSLTLGSLAGPQSFAAAAGAFSVSISATATAADASTILAFSGGGQSDTVRRALKQPLVAKVTDRFGNAIPGVTVTWARTAGTGTLGGTTSVTNGDGLASIGYTLGATVGPETITASASGVAGSATFTVTTLSSGPAAIVAVSGSGQTGRVSQPLGAPFIVKVSDDQGNPVSGVSVSWTAVNGSFGSSTTTTDATGQSSNTMTLGTATGAASATATAGGKSVTFSATVQAGVVARIVFRATPSNAIQGAPLTPAVAVEFRDAGGNLTSAANGVTLALGANPGEATLTGTLTRSAVSGVATFDDLRIDKPGTGYTLVATSAGLPTVTSGAFNVTSGVAGPAFKLAITTQPSATATSGVPLVQQPVIQVQDAAGVPTSGTEIQVSAAWSPGSVRNNFANASSTGVAAFTNLALLGTGTGTITFSASGLQSVTSVPVTVGAAAAAAMSLVDEETLTPLPVTPPPSVTMTAGKAPSNPPAIKVADGSGNGVAGVVVAYTVTRGGSPIFGGNATSDSRGIITFASLLISPSNLTVAGNYVFTATLTGVTGSPINLPVTVVPDAPAAVRFNTVFPTGGTAGSVLSPPIAVAITDQYANVITVATDNITMRITTGTGTAGAVLGGTLTRAAVNGIATFNDLTIDRAGTGYTLTASAASVAGGVSAVSPALTIGAAAGPAALTPVNAVNAVPANGSPLAAGSYPAVRATDASAAPVANVPVTFTFSGGTCLGPAEASSVVVNTDVNGVAALSVATYSVTTASAHSCLVIATASGLTPAAVSVVVMPTTPIKSWIGATSTAWNVGTNWFGGAVPATNDSVYVSAYVLNHPTLVAATTISGLRFENFATGILDVASFGLTINGDVSSQGAVIGNVTSPGVFLTGTGNRTFTGAFGVPVTIGATTCATATYTIAASSSLATSDLTVNCTLVIPAVTFVTVSGAFKVQGAQGRLQMQGSSGALNAAGNVTFDGADESGLLTQGSITIGGNLIIGNTNSTKAYAADLNQDIFFQSGNHTITVGVSASPTFGRMYVFGNVSVAGSTNLSNIGSLTVGSGGALTGGTISTVGALGQSGGSYAGVTRLVVNGHAFPEIDGAAPILTVVTSDSISPFFNNSLAGSLEVQGKLLVNHNINISGNLSVTGSLGELWMRASDGTAALLTIGGNATFAGKASTLMQAGTIVVGGNFNQLSTVSQASYAPGATHITRFTPGPSKTVTFANVDSSASHFGVVEVTSGAIDFASRVLTFGTFTNNAQVQFLSTGLQSIISGNMIFGDPSRTTLADGVNLYLLGDAVFPPSAANIIVVRTGTATLTFASGKGCVNGPTLGGGFCG